MTKAIVAAAIFVVCLTPFMGCDVLDDQCIRYPDSAERCTPDTLTP